jgi:uncharacterized membrane protein YfcA
MGDIELSLLAVLVLAIAFLAAGTVKGVIGAGLPTVAVPIAATVVEPAFAIALTVAPVLVANIWQAFQGGHYRPVLRAYWPLLLGLALGVVAGAQILVTVEPTAIALVMGVLVVLVCGYQLLSGSFTVPNAAKGWLNPLAGGVCGLFGGVAGMFAPTILYATALRLPKDVLVSLFGMIALCGTLPLYGSLAVNRVLAWDELVLSVVAAAPVGFGLLAGKWLRDRISQRTFERVLFSMLLLIGLNLIRKGLG